MANLYVEMFLPDSSRAILIPEDWQPCFFSHAGCFYFNYMLFYKNNQIEKLEKYGISFQKYGIMKKISFSEMSYDEISVGGCSDGRIIDWQDAPQQSELLFPCTFLYTKRWGSCHVRHHRYPYVALELILRGSATVELDGRKTRVAAGELFLMQRGRDCGFSTTANEHYEKMTLCLTGTILDLLVESLHLNAVPKITLLHVQEAERRFREIESLLREKVPGSERIIVEKTFSLFLFLGEENRGTRLGRYPEPLRKALEILHGSGIRGNAGIPHLADAVGVSNSTLIRMFHRYCGKSPMEYVTAMRMELAKNLLESTALSMKEIAGRIGYNDPLYFSSVFRKFTGMSPRAFRTFAREGG